MNHAHRDGDDVDAGSMAVTYAAVVAVEAVIIALLWILGRIYS